MEARVCPARSIKLRRYVGAASASGSLSREAETSDFAHKPGQVPSGAYIEAVPQWMDSAADARDSWRGLSALDSLKEIVFDEWSGINDLQCMVCNTEGLGNYFGRLAPTYVFSAILTDRRPSSHNWPWLEPSSPLAPSYPSTFICA